MLHSRAVDTTAVRPPALALLSALRKETRPCKGNKAAAYLREESRYDLLGGALTTTRSWYCPIKPLK